MKQIGATWASRGATVLLLIAVIVPARTWASSFLGFEGIAGYGIVGPVNGAVSPDRTGEELTRWLDDGTLDYLRFAPTPASDIFVQEDGSSAEFLADARAGGLFDIATREVSVGAFAMARRSFALPPIYETISESIGYLRDSLNFASDLTSEVQVNSFRVLASIDGHVSLAGDARAQLGVVLRLTDVLGERYVNAGQLVFSENGDYWFGGDSQNANAPLGARTRPAIQLEVQGPTLMFIGSPNVDPAFLQIEQLIFARAQVGINGGTGTAEINFLDTMAPIDIQLFDENDQLVRGVRVIGSRGNAYPYDAFATVPLPASGLLMLTAVVGLFCGRIQRVHSVIGLS